MNEKMAEYITKYLNEGHSLEKIRQFLLSQGYPDKEIKESALAAMQGEIKKAKKHSNLWIIPVIILFIIAGAAYYFQDEIKGVLNLNGETSIDDGSSAANTENPVINDNTQTDASPPPETTPPVQTTLCDIDCLIQASAVCDPKSMKYNVSVDFFGMLINTETYYEIRPGEKCQLYMRTDDYWVDINEETRQYLLSEGISEEEIELQILEMEAYKYEIIGREGTCIFDNLDNMQEYLIKTKEGTFEASVSCKAGIGENCVINTTASQEQNTTVYNCDSESECTYGGDYLLAKECSGTMFTASPINQ